MGGHLELVWFGLGLAGLGAGGAFLVWTPWYIERDLSYSADAGQVPGYRMLLLVVALLIAVLGLGLAAWHAVKLLIA
jgi:hypothetical protein